MSDLGFVGLGVMGRPMAGHLQAAGHRLFLTTRRHVPADLIAAGGVACASAAEVASQSDVIFTMLPDTDVVETVLFGPGGIAEGLSPEKIVCDMSSISPSETKKFSTRIAALGCSYFDAPVSGGEIGAKEASLTIMVGGDAAEFARIEPLLRTMGTNVTLVGPSGDGQTTKVANQIIVALTIEAVGEALIYASKAGADPVKVRTALMGGFASSRILDVHGKRMIERDFEPGARIALHQKDLALALSGARELGLSLPNTATCQELFNACVANGGAAWDHSAMVRALEMLANHTISDAPAPAPVDRS